MQAGPADSRRRRWLLPTLALNAGVAVAGLVALVASFFLGPVAVTLLALLFAAGLLLEALFLVFLWRRAKPWRPAFLVTAACTAAALLLANFVAGELLQRERFWGGFVPDDWTGWYPAANLVDSRLPAAGGRTYAVTTDRLGHRNAAPYPQDGRLPVLVQGDSHTFGFGLPDDATLGAQLNDLAGEPRFYNAGVPGFDVNQFYFQFEKLARHYDVDTRVILFNPANDFTYSALASPYLMRRPYLAVRGGDVIPVHSNLPKYHVPGYGTFFAPRFAEYDPLVNDGRHDWAVRCPDAVLRIPLLRQVVRHAYPKLARLPRILHSPPPRLELQDPPWLWLPEDEWPQPFRTFADEFPLLLRVIAEQHPRTVLCVFPTRTQIVPAESAARRKRLLADGAKPEDVEPFRGQRRLAAWCRTAGLVCLDATPRFRDAPSPSGLYQPGDEHLSHRGIALCAKTILEGLEGDGTGTSK